MHIAMKRQSEIAEPNSAKDPNRISPLCRVTRSATLAQIERILLPSSATPPFAGTRPVPEP
jgi:hypothetical protein